MPYSVGGKEYLKQIISTATPIECVLWDRSTCRGYGQYRLNQVRYYAHRVSLELKIGRSLDSKELACHTCDTPACVNPHHLFVGTDKDNAKDSALKDRKAQKLSNKDRVTIKQLLKEGVAGNDIAIKYGVSRQTVHYIKHNKPINLKETKLWH